MRSVTTVLATAALLVAVSLAAYVTATADSVRALSATTGVVALAFVLAALLALWEDGLVAGPALLLVVYSVGLAGRPLDREAPLLAAALLLLVHLGSWSLELRDGAEERPFAHLHTLLLLAVGAFLASSIVMIAGGVSVGGGIGLWTLGAAAAIGLFALLASPWRA